MAGSRFQGLVHISQLAKDRVENIHEVVTVNDEVFVKVLKYFFSRFFVHLIDYDIYPCKIQVIKIEENLPDGKTRISLSMKYCSQADGKDRDPNGFEAEADEKRKGPKKSGDHSCVCVYLCVCMIVCVCSVCL